VAGSGERPGRSPFGNPDSAALRSVGTSLSDIPVCRAPAIPGRLAGALRCETALAGSGGAVRHALRRRHWL
jgi:hypothetical protein